MLNIHLFALGAVLMTINAFATVPPPEPYGPVPTPRQLRWERGQMEAFVHFGMNTFTNKEWGYGDESCCCSAIMSVY